MASLPGPRGFGRRRVCVARRSAGAGAGACRRTPPPPPSPSGARGAGFPGSPGPSWILLLAEAGSEFRTVIPGGVTSEKFFFFFFGNIRRRPESGLGNSCKTQEQKPLPLRIPHRSHCGGGRRTAARPPGGRRSSPGSRVTDEGRKSCQAKP